MAHAAQDEVALRIVVADPPAGVAFAMQSGRSDLVLPSRSTLCEIVFDVSVGAVATGGTIRMLGPLAQGPRSARFLYLNSGARAGQAGGWDRRAKIPLAPITASLVSRARAGGRLEVRVHGTAKDGGPCCATLVPIAAWSVVED